MENTKAKNVIIIVLIAILLVFVGFVVYFMYNLSKNNTNVTTTSQLLSEIAIKNTEIENKQKQIDEISKNYEELKKEIESLKESSKNQATTSTTVKNELEGTIFSDITNDTFDSMKIIINNVNTGDSKSVTITKYTTALNVLKKLAKLTYKKTTTTGVGLGDYEVDINYKKSGKTYSLRVTDAMVLGAHLNGYVYSISGSTKLKNEIKQFITNTYNQNK